MHLFLLACFAITADELRHMPAVHHVSSSGLTDSAQRVIHILDWHFLPERVFLLDSPGADYAAFLRSVESLQDEERAIIHAMGVKSVFLEGLTDKSQQHFEERVNALRKFKKPLADDPVSAFISQLRREDELQLGAPGKMLIDGELDSVLPAEDSELHAAANPAKDERLVFNADANFARERAIANRLMSVNEAVIVLGGDHDLTVHLADTRYMRVSLKSYEAARHASEHAFKLAP